MRLWQCQFLSPCQFWLDLNSILNQFQMDYDSTKLILVGVLIIQLWIDFGSILSNFDFNLHYLIPILFIFHLISSIALLTYVDSIYILLLIYAMSAIKYLYIRNKGQGSLVNNEILMTMMNQTSLGRIILDFISHSCHLDSFKLKFV